MKKFKSILIVMLVIVAITMASCKDNKTETKTEMETTTGKQEKEYTSAYVCPMRCTDSGSDKEGKCGTCGMTLVKNEDHKANKHTHE